jgi:single-strand DNA-binding protein
LNDTPVTLVGNLCADPELTVTPTGTPVAALRLAVTPRVRDREQGWTDGPTSFYRVTCWRQLAEHAHDSLTKGARLVVTGRLRIRQYETDDGRRGQAVEVDADDLGPSLLFATATLTRATSGNGTSAASTDRPTFTPDPPPTY